jgi:predicted enzyme related to lactoylglutathione lyase
MERVRGIGGVFFKAKDPQALARWYADHLGLPVEGAGGASFRWKDDDLDGNATTVWSPFALDSSYFAPSTKPFMLNFRVKNLDRMLGQLREAGAAVDPKIEESAYGRFGWVMDPEGNRVELWEPPAFEGGPAPTPPVNGHDGPVTPGAPPSPSSPRAPSLGEEAPASPKPARKPKAAAKKKAARKPAPARKPKARKRR